jgi:NAD(P)-dependent dehydrogenase (short-subunit alcohol dehydrogenase family)
MAPQRIAITAAAGGIGRAITRAFHDAGARIHVCDINEDGLRGLASELDGVTYSVTDMSDAAAVQAFVEEAASTLGGLDVLVNNAGISGPTGPVETIDLDAWRAVLDVNLTGTLTACRTAIPHLRKSSAGSIVNLSSLGGRFAYANRSPYAVTKRGIIALTETLAVELGGDDVRVNAIAPGAVEGDRIRNVLKGRAEATGQPLEAVTDEAMSIQSLHRFVDADDIAALALFLTSDAGKSITGQTIAIDNGSQTAQ